MLTKQDILAVVDIEIKKVKAWGGELYIKQLTRADQDEYLNRQFGSTTMKQRGGAEQEISSVEIYGHDAFLCARGICDEDGKRLFSDRDMSKLERKNGEIVGRVAKEILEFSEMGEDVEELEDLKN